jgi:hypothetical protein
LKIYSSVWFYTLTQGAGSETQCVDRDLTRGLLERKREERKEKKERKNERRGRLMQLVSPPFCFPDRS